MNKAKTLLPALVTMVLWGLLFPTVKLGFAACAVSGTADILLFAGIRFVVCGAVICLLAFLRDRKSFRPARQTLPRILLMGAFAIILHYSFTYLGLASTDSSKTAILKQVGALFYVCFSFLFIKEDRPTVRKIAAALIGFAGILALNFTSEGIRFYPGDLLILAASFCTVLANVTGKKVFAAVSPIPATGISQLFGGLVLLGIGGAMGGSVSIIPGRPMGIFAVICLASIISYCLWYGIVKKGELSGLFIIKFSEPVFAALFGALLLGENIRRWQYPAAFLLISSSILLSSIRPAPQKSGV